MVEKFLEDDILLFAESSYCLFHLNYNRMRENVYQKYSYILVDYLLKTVGLCV